MNVALAILIGSLILVLAGVLLRLYARAEMARTIEEYERKFHRCGVCAFHRYARTHAMTSDARPPSHWCLNRGRRYPEPEGTP